MLKHRVCLVAGVLVAPFLFLGCMVDGSGDEFAEDGETAESQQAITIYSGDITITESTTWPKTVTWCVPTHSTHAPSFDWALSGQTAHQFTSTNCIARTTNVEVCNWWVRVDGDSQGHTSANAYDDVWDQRNPVVTGPAMSLAVGASYPLVAPAPHGTLHCDGTGSFVWQVKNAVGQFNDISSSLKMTPFTVSSSVAGSETYRLKSTFKGVTVYSNEVPITWAAVTTCTINGTSYANGATNPNNSCQKCNVSVSATTWTTSPVGTTCNDGNANTSNDKCTSGGICQGTYSVCTPGTYRACTACCNTMAAKDQSNSLQCTMCEGEQFCNASGSGWSACGLF